MPTEEKRQAIHQQTDTDQQYLLFRIFHDAPAVSVLSSHGTRSGNDRSSAWAHHESLHVKTMSSRLHARRSTTCVG